MAKRKVTSRQLNIRMPDDLHKKITSEAKKNGWPVNRELVRRLERSFIEQEVEAIVVSAAKGATDHYKNVLGHIDVVMRDVREELQRIHQSVTGQLNAPAVPADPITNVKKRTDSNG